MKEAKYGTVKQEEKRETTEKYGCSEGELLSIVMTEKGAKVLGMR